MRRLCLNTILLLLAALTLQAQIHVSGTFTSVTPAVGVDSVLVFDNLSATDAYIEYTGTATPRWTDFVGTLVQQGVGAETLYPEHNTGYRLYEGDSLVAAVFVLDYSAVRPDPSADEPHADMYCDHTTLTINTLVPVMSYTDTLGRTHPVDRLARVCYTTLAWLGSDWNDSVVCEELTLRQGVTTQELLLEPPYRNTSFTVFYDTQFHSLTLPDSVLTSDYEAVAVTCMPASVTTSRDYNNKGIENEPQRPIDESALTGSAPLDINFLSNANKPVAKYYRWRIFKGSTLLAERFDEDQRYTFTENGNYQVKLWVYNDTCSTDSTVFDISVSESLLKVPNVFTPNGDGQNDEFRVVYRSLAEFHCWVYNRWGKLVYQWDDPAKGWDGTINGHPAAEGAYYYVIRARGTEANPADKYHKVTKRHLADIGVYQLSGAINLIRGK